MRLKVLRSNPAEKQPQKRQKYHHGYGDDFDLTPRLSADPSFHECKEPYKIWNA